MQSRIIGTFWVTTICCIVSVLALLGVPAECGDVIEVHLSIAPSRIILNAECVGSFQDIQAIFPFNLAPVEESLEGWFYFGDDVEPVTTDSFHYCYVDDNLLVSFDRGEIQAYAKELELADDVYEVRVSCTFDATCNDVTETYTLMGTDFVEILTPGNKKE